MRDPANELAELRRQDLLRRLRTAHRTGPVLVEENGRALIQFASNDYLGLAASQALRAAFQEAVAHYGAGSGASRLITGTHGPHVELEEQLAIFKGTPRALAFSSGYAAAVGSIPAIIGPEDFAILDKLCHACLIDGVRLSGATMRVFPHNDIGKLADHLRWARSKAAPTSRILVLTESVFSMDGDLADLARIVELKDQAGALLWLDEAHAVGVLGWEGRGLAEHLRLAPRVDFQMGTLSKAMGVVGGYVAAAADWIDLLVQRARSLVFSTAPPPAVAATACEALRLVRGQEGEVLRMNLRTNLASLARVIGKPEPMPSAICPWMVGESSKAMELSEQLREAGFWVPAIRYPTVPRGSARLRISVSAAHDAEDIERLGAALLRGAGGR